MKMKDIKLGKSYKVAWRKGARQVPNWPIDLENTKYISIMPDDILRCVAVGGWRPVFQVKGMYCFFTEHSRIWEYIKPTRAALEEEIQHHIDQIKKIEQEIQCL